MQNALDRPATPTSASTAASDAAHNTSLSVTNLFHVFDPVDVTTGWRHGAGTPHPGMPQSQRLYDGENPFENCEPWNLP